MAILPEAAKARLWAASHDMYLDASEQFYGGIYLTHILSVVNKYPQEDKLRILDLGCGHGRLAIQLAKQGYHVVAVEKNETALRRAIEHAAKEGVAIDFRKCDMLLGKPLGMFDVVMAIEPLRLLGSRSEVKRLIPIVKENLRTGGIAVLSVRTRYYNVARAIRLGNYVRAQMIAKDKDTVRWLIPSKLRSMLSDAGFDSIEIMGIGTVSGESIDPFGCISVPGEVSDDKRRLLESIEIEMGSMNEISGCGRYMLALARKRTA
jgi:2-polyprenyl-3-methyl-5-hydroxy-6-metoxy-1,4-benzoquinol methylase